MNKPFLRALLLILSISLSSPLVHAQAVTLLLAKTIEGQSVAVNGLDNNAAGYCIAGETYDVDTQAGHGLVFYVTKDRQVYRYDFSQDQDFYKGAATHCFINDADLFILRKLSTHPSASLNQDLLFVSRLQLINHKWVLKEDKALSVGYSAFAYAFTKNQADILLQGVVKEKDAHYSRFKTTLRIPSLVNRQTQIEETTVEGMLEHLNDLRQYIKQEVRSHIQKNDTGLYLLIKE